mgnify:CR=1 FL=1
MPIYTIGIGIKATEIDVRFKLSKISRVGVRIERGLGNTTAAQNYAERLKLEYPRAAQTKELLESERNPG